MKEVIVLRYGHRLIRDARVTTHCALVARALGASKIIICGDEDPQYIEQLNKTSTDWGGKFRAEQGAEWKQIVRHYKVRHYTVLHNTMYGIPIQDEIQEIRKKNKFLIIIGSQKVPIEAYKEADYNIAITGQPHSEIASLAITMHEIFEGKELSKKFAKAEKKVIPQKIGKKIITNKNTTHDK
ncbi:MAG: tRNA (cytidine(56)-2'-O)-methyltransferase [Candidatus Diapherotrites archaeon]|nr:tRNA (cytidine(56)-2'-O)-methyltransferase [Candidatus Diapherotrites archaeon]